MPTLHIRVLNILVPKSLEPNKECGEKISDIKKFYNERESDKKFWNKGERWVIATKFNME